VVVWSKGREKKMKTLEKFWYGNIRPNERAIPPDGGHDKLLKQVVQNEDAIAPCCQKKPENCLTNSKITKLNCPA